MHIPDGFLSLPVSAGSGVLSVGGLVLALKRLKKQVGDRLVPLMGVMAAFIFAAQMFNFPVAGGTSGHLLGGALAAIVLGPMAGTVVLTVVLIVQCLLFQDGGLIALGANVFNMAIVGVWGAWAVFESVKRMVPHWGLVVAPFVAAWISVVLAASMCAFELSLSGTMPFPTALIAMVSVHSVVGVGEGIITVLVVTFLKRVKPELI
jgi:cobalt/nickel transport system permease protein